MHLFKVESGTDETELENYENRLVSSEITPAYIHVKIFVKHAGSIEPWVKIVTRGQT